jgi:uncharacterized protein (TIGR02453 family)
MKNIHLLDEASYPPFTGFPRDGIHFLSRLKKNNNRDWFHKHKDEYEHLVRFPMECLISSLSGRMREVAPEIEFHPQRSIFRIYRDVRFSRNKLPYKTNIAASFHLRGKKGHESPGFYLHIEPGSVFVGGGLYMPDGDQLKAIRRSIAEGPEEFLEIIGDRLFKKEYGGIQGEKLQRAPLGFAPDHPMVDHLRHKQFFVGKEMPEGSCLSPRFEGTVARLFGIALPLVRWLPRL